VRLQPNVKKKQSLLVKLLRRIGRRNKMKHLTPEIFNEAFKVAMRSEPGPFFLPRSLAECITLDELNSLGPIITDEDTRKFGSRNEA
jgi:hypothetical protein